jgi:transmembrane sensor
MDVRSIDNARTVHARPSRFRAGVPSLMMAASIGIVMLGLVTWRALFYHGALPGNEAVYATAIGQTTDVTLPDGSLVHLGPVSELRVKAGYGKNRDVTIDGLARFSVVHKASRPFVVHAGDATVEDIGTVFSVRTDDQGAVAVVVTSGSVKLRSARVTSDEGVVLNQGDRGRVATGAEAAVAEHGAATAGDTAWTRGGLVFEDASLDRVRADLRRWYGVAVVTGDSALLSRHLTATFENDSIDQVLHVIGLALDAPITRHGDTVYIGARH